MTITPPPIHSYETPTYSELANDFRSWVDWLWRTWYVAAADPDLEWESIPGAVVELDVLWRSWAHAWSGAGSGVSGWIIYRARLIIWLGWWRTGMSRRVWRPPARLIL